MSLADRIKSGYLSLTGKASSTTVEVVENKAVSSKKSKTYAQVPERKQIFRTNEDIRTWEKAITDAESATFDREDLHQVYKQIVWEDAHVVSQWNNRKMKTLKKDFGVFVGDNDAKDDDLTELFQSNWFHDFIDKVLDKMAWGFQCVELANWNPNTMQFESYRGADGLIYDAVQVIKHNYVKPEYGIIVNQPAQIQGIDIFKYPNQLIFTGGKDHGFLYKLARPCMFKHNATANWSEWIEVFGLDTILFFSEAEESERRNLLEAVKQLGTSRMGVFDIDDKAEAFGSNKTDAYKVFEQMNRYVDESISKIIFGQDGVSNNTGQVVGSVGENVANDYANSDAKYITYVVNNYLFPLMTRAGYLDLANASFKYDESMSMREMNERADIDLKLTQMGFKHDVDQLNEKYGVNLESTGTATVEEVRNKLNNLYPNGRL